MSQFKKIIGTGGIGGGVVYALEGNHDLGRNESRMGHLQDARDYCKLHIIFHYLSVLLRDLKSPIEVIPIGAVGNDAWGADLLKNMEQAGMKLRHTRTLDGAPTLFSVCYQFPDKSGGNITEAQSAGSKVTPRDVRKAARELAGTKGRAMVLAAPEVPLESRITLLKLGRKHDAFNVASFVSEEIAAVREQNLLALTDLMAVNIDEAATLGNISARRRPEQILRACVASAQKMNPNLLLSITNGAQGMYGYNGDTVQFLPSLKVRPKNTAGAGDAALAGLMLGILQELPFVAPQGPCCLKFARLLSALSVTSADTINFDINLRSLRAFAKRQRQGTII